MRALFVWRGGLFLTEGEIGMLSVSSLLLTQAGVYVGVCVYIRTHIHTLHMAYSDVSLGVRTRHLEPKESRWIKSRHICLRISVQRTHVYVYVGRQDEIRDLLFCFLNILTHIHRYLKSKVDLSA